MTIDCMNLAEARKALAAQPGIHGALAVQKLKRIMDQNARAVRSRFFVVPR